MPKIIDLTGKKFGRLTVMHRIGKSCPVRWFCLCDCGSSAVVYGYNLPRNHTKSCGCLQKEILSTRNTVHGHCRYPLYHIWRWMLKRCGYRAGTTAKEKRNYADRGIVVCKEWLEFVPFYEWAKDKWSPNLQIDRKDNNGNYAPDNCRFVTQKVNLQNTIFSKRWFLWGQKYNSACEAANAVGVTKTTIRKWCCGYKSKGKKYPPKKDCYAVRLYKSNHSSQPDTPKGMLNPGKRERVSSHTTV